jgi:hypothetical protein
MAGIKRVLELDVDIRPSEPIYHNRLALYSDESADAIDPPIDDFSNHAGFLEKNLSDFFDI